jgi:predicted phosphohydrolase
MTHRIHVHLSQLYYISDTHLEHTECGKRTIPLTSPASTDRPGTAMALLGDIGWIHEDTYWELVGQCSALYGYVFIVLGNHEYYRQCIQEFPTLFRNELHKHCFPNVFFLENGTVEFDNVILWGSTLWTRPTWEAFQSSNDVQCIRDKSVPKPHRLSIGTVYAAHHRAVQSLQKELTKSGKPYIVLTHHAPLPQSNGELYRHSSLASIYVNFQLESLFTSPSPTPTPILAWLYGHTHQNMTFTFNGVYVGTNAFGYPNETLDPPFDPQKCFTLSTPPPVPSE